MKKFLAALSGASLLIAAPAAAASSAQSLSLSRVSATTEGESELAGAGFLGLVLGGAFLAAVVYAAIEGSDNDDDGDDYPISA